jgi:hypothetical protein
LTYTHEPAIDPLRTPRTQCRRGLFLEASAGFAAHRGRHRSRGDVARTAVPTPRGQERAARMNKRAARTNERAARTNERAASATLMGSLTIRLLVAGRIRPR